MQKYNVMVTEQANVGAFTEARKACLKCLTNTKWKKLQQKQQTNDKFYNLT